MLRRQFHSIAVAESSLSRINIDSAEPLIVYANHPSWWDPLIAHFLNRRLFSPRQFYAPIDADALEQYRVFAKLGFFGVKMNSSKGAANFLRQSTAILNSSNTALWLTPEGRFADVRDHSEELMPGLAHLCTRVQRATAIPLALEYVFWEERLPVCLAQFGEPSPVADRNDLTKSQWSELLEDRLRTAQTELSNLAIARSSEPFTNLMKGKTGGGMIYDLARRVKSIATGKKFQATHGRQFESGEDKR